MPATMMRRFFSSRLSFNGFIKDDSLLPTSTSSPAQSPDASPVLYDNEAQSPLDSPTPMPYFPQLTSRRKSLSNVVSKSGSPLLAALAAPILPSSVITLRTTLSLSMTMPSSMSCRRRIKPVFVLLVTIIIVMVTVLLASSAVIDSGDKSIATAPAVSSGGRGNGVGLLRPPVEQPISVLTEHLKNKLLNPAVVNPRNHLLPSLMLANGSHTDAPSGDWLNHVLPSCAVIDHNMTLSLLRYAGFIQHMAIHGDCTKYPNTGDCRYNGVDYRPRWLVLHYSAGNAGGYGDRMKGLLSLLPLAMITGRAFAISYDDHIPFIDIFEPALLEWVTMADIQYQVKYNRVIPSGLSAQQAEDIAKEYKYPYHSLKDIDWINKEHVMSVSQTDWTHEWRDYDIVRIRHNLNSFNDLLDNTHFSELYRRFGFHSTSEKGDMDLYWTCLMDYAFHYNENIRIVLNPLLESIGRPVIDSWEQRVERIQDGINDKIQTTKTETAVVKTNNEKTVVSSAIEGGMSSWLSSLAAYLRPLVSSDSESVESAGTTTDGRLYCAQLRMGTNGRHGNKSIAFHDSEAFLSQDQLSDILGQFQSLIGRDQLALNGGISTSKNYKLFITSDCDDWYELLPQSLQSAPLITVPGRTAHMDKIDPETAKDYQATLEAYIKVIVTHHLLGECDVAIISASGFGATSRWRTRNRGLTEYQSPLTASVYEGTYRVSNTNTTLFPYQHMRGSGGREDNKDYMPIFPTVRTSIEADIGQSLPIANTVNNINDNSIDRYQSSSAMPSIPANDTSNILPSVSSSVAKQLQMLNRKVPLQLVTRTVRYSDYYHDCIASFTNSSHPVNDGLNVMIGIVSDATIMSYQSRQRHRSLYAVWSLPVLADYETLCLEAEKRIFLQQGYVPDHYVPPYLSKQHALRQRQWRHGGQCDTNSQYINVDLSFYSIYDKIDFKFIIDRAGLSEAQRAELDREQQQFSDLYFINENNFNSSNCHCYYNAGNNIDITNPLDRGHSQYTRMSFIQQLVVDSENQCQCSNSPITSNHPQTYRAYDFVTMIESTTFVHMPHLITKLRGYASKSLTEVFAGLMTHSPTNIDSATTMASHVVFSHLTNGFVLSWDLCQFFITDTARVIIQSWKQQQKAQTHHEWGQWLTARGRLLGRDSIGVPPATSALSETETDSELAYKLNHALINNYINLMPLMYSHPLSQSHYSLPQFISLASSHHTVMIIDVDNATKLTSIIKHFQCRQPWRFDWRANQWWNDRNVVGGNGIVLNGNGEPVRQTDWHNDWGQEYRKNYFTQLQAKNSNV